MSDLTALVPTLKPYLASLSPAQLTQLNKKIALDLRKSQRERIARQQNPDGSAYEPRKRQRKRKKSKIKRQMFTKLRQAKYMRNKSTANEVNISITVPFAHIHQFGLRGKVDKAGKIYTPYARRELLGFSSQDEQLIVDAFHKHFANL